MNYKCMFVPKRGGTLGLLDELWKYSCTMGYPLAAFMYTVT